MAHFCPPELLDDLGDLLAEIRGWRGVVERSPGVFYVGREPFLHFHLLRGVTRRGDVKGRSEWSQVELPRPLPRTDRAAFRRELQKRYAEKAPR